MRAHPSQRLRANDRADLIGDPGQTGSRLIVHELSGERTNELRENDRATLSEAGALVHRNTVHERQDHLRL